MKRALRYLSRKWMLFQYRRLMAKIVAGPPENLPLEVKNSEFWKIHNQWGEAERIRLAAAEKAFTRARNLNRLITRKLGVVG